ncbi:LolA-like outer membrane lipoprotein chaperone [Sulfurimonas sp.]
MKSLLSIILCSSLSYGAIDNINSFQAEFIQSVTDDKNVSLQYNGHISAKKPQNAVWNYLKPIKKDVYINKYSVTVVEPEIEQVIIRRIKSNFDFFVLVKNAVEVNKNTYETMYKETKFTITTQNELIKSISYKDEFDNDVKIIFKNQKQNIKIDKEIFIAKYPLEFDIIRD